MKKATTNARPPRRPRSFSYWTRKAHRYLGLLIGIQFVAWTVGGLYFSWTDLEEVHGDHLHQRAPLLSADAPLVSPSNIVDAIRTNEPVDSLANLDLANVFGRPHYRIRYFTTERGQPVRRIQLADATTGELRPPLSREEAVRMAQAAFAHEAPIESLEWLTRENIGGHHEYREQPLPAWAVRFDHPSGATAYVPAELAQVQRIRHDTWRTFDFLWMLHTMDYRGRDNFNNLLLRVFSVLGLVTIASGFVLYGLTSRTLRGRRRRR